MQVMNLCGSKSNMIIIQMRCATHTMVITGIVKSNKIGRGVQIYFNLSISIVLTDMRLTTSVCHCCLVIFNRATVKSHN